MLVNKPTSTSQYQDGDNMSYYEKEDLKQLPQASNCPKSSGKGGYDHMGLIKFIDGLLIDVPRIPDYWITVRLNTAFKGHARMWYTELKKIHGRRNWPWWNIQIIQKYSNGTWIWEKTMSFENYKYSVDIYPYQWCLRESKRLKAIDPQMNIQMRNHTFQENWSMQAEFKDKPRERVAEVTKKKNSFCNCGSTDYYANNCPEANKKVYEMEKVPEEESPKKDSESDSMADVIRQQSDEEQDSREEFLVHYQKETPLEIQDIWLEAGMPQDTANKNFCKHNTRCTKLLHYTK
ncbi:hypothetical protein O181_028581 [Austropuccinia psidii MF-1]|uniref:Uncharacterized protein n=1 Tax=Austropuccinia psidii MF-1 TaxID=1389203 RepID=A0A9Q3CPF7_9BASI|nr:hypothetical protein [Austropuccinia psidii MF-1]